MKYWIATPAQAEEFFKRCLEREAITQIEREEVMSEMQREFNIDGGEFNEEDSGEIDALLKRNGGVIGFNTSDDSDTNGGNA